MNQDVRVGRGTRPELVELVVWLSSPYDVLGARDRVETAIRHLNGALRPAGVGLRVWRDDLDAGPNVGEDPQVVVDDQMPTIDIYVGLMGDRVGTPVQGHPSGTLAEFASAQDAGVPFVMFYFRSAALASNADVRRVRDAFPGLFGTYCDLDDLERRVGRDLLRAAVALRDGESRERTRAWIRAARRHLPADLRPRRAVDRIGRFFDLPGLITPGEFGWVSKAIYYHELNSAPGVRAGAPHDADAAWLLGASFDPTDPAVQGRQELLAGIVRLALLLCRDKTTFRDMRRPPSRDDDPVEEWLAWCTQQVEIEGRCRVRVDLRVADADFDIVARCIHVAFGVALARIVYAVGRADQGLRVSVGGCSVVPSSSEDRVALSPGVRAAMEVRAREYHEGLPRFEHLGPVGHDQALLPLPLTAIDDAFVIDLDAGSYVLELIPIDAEANRPVGATVSRKIESGDPRRVYVPATALECSPRWSWSVCARGYVEAAGVLTVLSPVECAAYRHRISLGEDRAAVLLEFDLWQHLVVEHLHAGDRLLVPDALAFMRMFAACREWLVCNGHAKTVLADVYEDMVAKLSSRVMSASQ